MAKQDEYQRLWHEAAKERDSLREQLERKDRQVQAWKRRDDSMLRARAERDSLRAAAEGLAEALREIEAIDGPCRCHILAVVALAAYSSEPGKQAGEQIGAAPSEQDAAPGSETFERVVKAARVVASVYPEGWGARMDGLRAALAALDAEREAGE